MKKSCMILFCLLFFWGSVSGAFAQGANQNIHQAQEKLSALGYTPGPADGMMGEKTQGAVKKFQKDRGLTVTGHLDNQTLNLLLNLTPELAQATGKVSAAVNQALSTAQQLLQALGYTPGPADGRMGHKTRAAIEKFQRDQKLPVTGSLNDTTLQKIRHLSDNKGNHKEQKKHTSGKPEQQGRSTPSKDKNFRQDMNDMNTHKEEPKG